MPIQENDKIWEFTQRHAERYDEVVAADTEQYYARYDVILEKVVALAALAPGKRVLDIGTGTGALALRCLATGAHVVGVDPSTPMLAKAREKVGQNPNAEFHQCPEPFLELPYPEASFDAVVSTYAYHHIPHQLKTKTVREMLRVLKPGGRWVVGDLAFENEDAETEAYNKFRWLEQEYFTRIDSLREAFAACGIGLLARQFTPVTWVLWAIKNEA